MVTLTVVPVAEDAISDLMYQAWPPNWCTLSCIPIMPTPETNFAITSRGSKRGGHFRVWNTRKRLEFSDWLRNSMYMGQASLIQRFFK